jgi:hypothetical protein
MCFDWAMGRNGRVFVMTEQKTNLNNLLVRDLTLETQLLKSFYLDYKQVNVEHVFELLETFNSLLLKSKNVI